MKWYALSVIAVCLFMLLSHYILLLFIVAYAEGGFRGSAPIEDKKVFLEQTLQPSIMLRHVKLYLNFCSYHYFW